MTPPTSQIDRAHVLRTIEAMCAGYVAGDRQATAPVPHPSFTTFDSARGSLIDGFDQLTEVRSSRPSGDWR